ncbi:MAG: UDPGP type 1 family protein, partial [Xanthomonadales bacterium]|nr:UDPGP type 1 family protein [Xanthomonadales bacterium]NIO13061.1 UDPGP type 1 family protein [Xanthomonadales bacterium]
LIPWVLMTSPDNDAGTRRFFADNDYFGLGEENVRCFTQQMNPILDSEGRLLRCEPDELLTGPDGHGGIFEAMAKGHVLDYLRSGGWDLISYFQVDNPLVTVADERFLGHHLNQSADFSCKVVPKRDPEEGLGLAVRKSGRPAVVEYVDVPEEIASDRLPSGKLRYRYGSIAIHIMDVPFAERLSGPDGALPWHIAHKQYEVVNDGGERVTTDPEGCRKFERFVFDALT